MRSQTFTRVIAMTIFSALATSAPLAAQEQGAGLQHKKEHHRYRLIDIGTFGGPESNVNLGVQPRPRIGVVNHAPQKAQPLGCIVAVLPNVVFTDLRVQARKSRGCGAQSYIATAPYKHF